MGLHESLVKEKDYIICSIFRVTEHEETIFITDETHSHTTLSYPDCQLGESQEFDEMSIPDETASPYSFS
ncbi:hypothetical protein EB796_022760 [Bugula neritina]|uniref:Uncharacterized protein n=1 Tax=Bugula neritina TaxID=10212 RepID=A0A7J7IYF2_BUGNE|nr:hypothetical protein EB796_022760 [Bugula neritina]